MSTSGLKVKDRSPFGPETSIRFWESWTVTPSGIETGNLPIFDILIFGFFLIFNYYYQTSQMTSPPNFFFFASCAAMTP